MFTPIGALTSKPYAFVSRPWEINSSEGIDFFDSFLSNIRIDERGLKIIRILPVSSSFNNEFWISDRIRFCYNFQNNQVLHDSFVFYDSFSFVISNKQMSILFYLVFSKIDSVSCEFGTPTPMEFQYFFSTFCSFFNKSFLNIDDCYNSKFKFSDFRSSFVSPNVKTFSAASTRDAFFILNFNSRFSFPVFNSFAKSVFFNSNFPVFYFGSSYNSNFTNHLNVGSNLASFINFISFKSKVNKLFFNSNIFSNIFFSSKDFAYFSNSRISSYFFSNCKIFPINFSTSSIISSELNFNSFNFSNFSNLNNDFSFISYNSSFEYNFNKNHPKFNFSLESNFDFSFFSSNFLDFSRPDFVVSFQNIFLFTSTFISTDGFSKVSNNFKKLPHVSSFIYKLFYNFFPFIIDEDHFYKYFFKNNGDFFYTNMRSLPLFTVDHGSDIFDSSFNFSSDSFFSVESARSHYLRSPYSRYSTPLVLQYSRLKSLGFNHS